MTESTNNADLDKVIRKIQKCLALSKSSNAGEAAAALRQAQKMMELYNVTAEGIVMSDIDVTRANSTACTKPPAWELALAHLVSQAFRCRLLWLTGVFDSIRNRDIAKGRWEFVGLKHEAQIAAYSMDVLRRQLLKARERHLKEWVLENEGARLKSKLAASTAFSEGFVSNVARQVHSIAPHEPTVAKAIEDKATGMINTDKKMKTTSREQGAWEDYQAGKKAGESATLHRPMGPASKPADKVGQQ
jgi:hypothetical protein